MFTNDIAMKFKKTDLIEAVGGIILQSGINSLSIEEIAKRMGIPENELLFYFKSENSVLIMLFVCLEKEIQKIIHESDIQKQSPDQEIRNLFGELNNFFIEKPFYLPLIFSNDLIEKDAEIHEIIERIKTSAEMHLVKLINEGKHKKLFHTEKRTWLLVNRILGSFRLLMNEQKITSDLIREMGLIRGEKVPDFKTNAN